MNIVPKVGVVSCSGEASIGGTISRIATRLVLERLRPEDTVTLCLPLFLAGEKGERMFARNFPTISVDGCGKKCALRAIEKYSGKTAKSIVVDDLLGERDLLKLGSRRELSSEGLKATESVAEEIASAIDGIVRRSA